MNEPKRQHWVPKAYLRRFAVPGTDPEKIWVTTKSSAPSKRSLKNVSVEKFLYSPSDENGLRDYSTEHKISEFETDLGGRVWDEITTGFVDLKDQHIRMSIALAVAIMYLRNPRRLSFVREIYATLKEANNRFGGDEGIAGIMDRDGTSHDFSPEDWKTVYEMSDDDEKRQWLRHLNSATDLAEIIIKMRWSITVSDENLFTTSDDPVTLIAGFSGFAGFKREDVTVLYPLSPTRMLVLDNREQHNDGGYYQAKRPELYDALIWRYAISDLYSHFHPQDIFERWTSQK